MWQFIIIDAFRDHTFYKIINMKMILIDGLAFPISKCKSDWKHLENIFNKDETLRNTDIYFKEIILVHSKNLEFLSQNSGQKSRGEHILVNNYRYNLIMMIECHIKQRKLG